MCIICGKDTTTVILSNGEEVVVDLPPDRSTQRCPGCKHVHVIESYNPHTCNGTLGRGE